MKLESIGQNIILKNDGVEKYNFGKFGVLKGKFEKIWGWFVSL